MEREATVAAMPGDGDKPPAPDGPAMRYMRMSEQEAVGLKGAMPDNAEPEHHAAEDDGIAQRGADDILDTPGAAPGFQPCAGRSHQVGVASLPAACSPGVPLARRAGPYEVVSLQR